MNDDDRKEMKDRLTALRHELEDTLAHSEDASRPVALDQPSIGRLSRMDAMQGQAMAQETRRRQQHQLLRIERALRDLDNDEYGYCDDCGKGIDPRRLRIDPTARLCLTCAQSREV
ncbi:TraR/DksA family transcriptional regulator [Alloalcanivorax xenomutans]|uniref:TraR/DksA family transcriptional regulator n=1 Tax=Alloalcanivorax xenomutans TaxID=1094342 RepID=UPI00047CC798|nr:TraR/DksA family transcriptional regulator [Alloalcanivorax xenomutans]ARB46701.1 molecular chaperone DnaK [Alloalcanivorax xenomutans]MBA4722933.1 TraR/DksA family transcriptional regulator [Alcanivorax sp.]WOA30441.1 TraR/DksA family transcriptional regulator [Alloalcanivorax xenomutans]WOD27319.1 TraR/DksA family transcriptional regulator [Alloalcanivorax xenomutans]